MAPERTPPAARGKRGLKLKTMVSLESKDLRDWIDDDVHRGIRAGRYPEGYSRSDWINEAIHARRRSIERRSKK